MRVITYLNQLRSSLFLSTYKFGNVNKVSLGKVDNVSAGDGIRIVQKVGRRRLFHPYANITENVFQPSSSKQAQLNFKPATQTTNMTNQNSGK